MTVLSVNLNKLALIRNSRVTSIPDLVAAARICIASGASGITVHPRPDMRHIRPSDVRNLASLLTSEHPEIELNIEGNPFAGPEKSAGESYPGFMELIRTTRPDQATLVPDDPGQLTSDHGWNLNRDLERLQPVIDELRALGIRSSLFMDPDPEQIRLAGNLGTDRIELYTGPYAASFGSVDQDRVYKTFYHAAEVARDEGLGLNAGHDLNLDNLALFSEVPNLLEVSIGHAIICDALNLGLEETVRRYNTILQR